MQQEYNRQTIQYESYILRLWRENPESEWRILLKEIDTGRQIVFANLEGLTAFLNKRLSLGHKVDVFSEAKPPPSYLEGQTPPSANGTANDFVMDRP